VDRSVNNVRRERNSRVHAACFTEDDEQLLVSASKIRKSQISHFIRVYTSHGQLISELKYSEPMCISTMAILDEKTFLAGDDGGLLSVWERISKKPKKKRAKTTKTSSYSWKRERRKGTRCVGEWGEMEDDAGGIRAIIPLRHKTIPEKSASQIAICGEGSPRETCNPKDYRTCLVVYKNGHIVEWEPINSEFIRRPYMLWDPGEEGSLETCGPILVGSVLQNDKKRRSWIFEAIIFASSCGRQNTNEAYIVFIGPDGFVRKHKIEPEEKSSPKGQKSTFCQGSVVTYIHPGVQAVSPYVAIGHITGEVSCYSAISGQLVGRLKDQKSKISALAFHSSRPLFVSGACDGRLCIYRSSGPR